MKCQNCGEELRETAKFCPKCGHEVSIEMPSDEQPDASADDEKSNDENDAVEDTPSSDDQVDAPMVSPDRRKKLVIGLLVIIVIACLGYTAVTKFFGAGNSEIAFHLEDIEDEAFRSYLQETVDTDADGTISQVEADAVDAIGAVDGAGNITDIGLSGRGVKSLDGIEHFDNLKTLICDDNALVSLDVSENSKLVYLSCENNALSELILARFGSLAVLHATNNQLPVIDLSMQVELRDLKLDPSVAVRGTEGPSDEETKTKIEDLALVFAVARGLSYGSESDTGNLVTDPGMSANTDNMLIEAVLSSSLFPTRNLVYALESLSDISYDDAGMISIPRAQGEAVIRSVYGFVPEDLSYLYAANGLATYLGEDGWYVFPAQGEASFDIASDNWQGYGRLVSFDACILNGAGPQILDAARQTYRVTVVEDEESMFGYHLVSMVSLDNANTPSGSQSEAQNATTSTAEDGNGSEDNAQSTEMVDSIVQWAESEQGGSSSSPSDSSDESGAAEEAETWPDFDRLLGTWDGTLIETEHNSVTDQAACYGGKTHPFTVTFTSVDAAMGTAVVDMRALIHSHGGLENAADETEGDRYVELSDVLVTLRENSNATYQVYEGKDIGPYYINFCFNEDGSFVAEVYTEAKMTNPFIAWRRDTFEMKKH